MQPKLLILGLFAVCIGCGSDASLAEPEAIPVRVEGADVAVVYFASGQDCVTCLFAARRLCQSLNRSGDSVAFVIALQCEALADCGEVIGWDDANRAFAFADSTNWRASRGLPKHTRYAVVELQADRVVTAYDASMRRIDAN